MGRVPRQTIGARVMSAQPKDPTDEARRRRLRAALDDLAPDPLAVSDRSESADGSDTDKEPLRGGLSEEALRRERPPHHGG